nr:hypothetical protein [Tanacetum cinerariifolium]
GGPIPANGKLLVAQHIHDAHGRKGYFAEVGPLRHGRAHEQAAVRAARDGEVVGVGVVQHFQLHAAFVGDEHRNLGAVLAGVEYLRGEVLGGVHVHRRRLENGALVGGRVVFINRSRVRKRREGVVQVLVGAPPAKARRRADGR